MKVLTILDAFSEQGIIDKLCFFQYNIFRENVPLPAGEVCSIPPDRAFPVNGNLAL